MGVFFWVILIKCLISMISVLSLSVAGPAALDKTHWLSQKVS